jgi:thiamine biosynthesis lipoprotein
LDRVVPPIRWLTLLCMGGLSFVGCAIPTSPMGGSASPRIVVSDGWLAMGTFFEIDLRVRPIEEEIARDFIEWARLEIARLEKIYSRHNPDSELEALNRSLAHDDILIGGAHIEAELESLLFSGVDVWQGSGGAFDMTIGPLVEVWVDAIAGGHWPSVAELRAAKARIGSEAFLLLGDGVLKVLKLGMRIDLDGISKGAVLDHLRSRFQEDLPNAAALFNFGESSIIAIGDPDGEGWRLEIRSRVALGENGNVIHLRDQALAVSSSIGSVSEIAGERVSHVIDPRTGSIIRNGVEAIVLADRAALADGWSTALLVVGANRTALRLLEKVGLEANVLESTGRTVSTEGWEQALGRP